jgi:hypothetical protein
MIVHATMTTSESPKLYSERPPIRQPDGRDAADDQAALRHGFRGQPAQAADRVGVEGDPEPEPRGQA